MMVNISGQVDEIRVTWEMSLWGAHLGNILKRLTGEERPTHFSQHCYSILDPTLNKKGTERKSQGSFTLVWFVFHRFMAHFDWVICFLYFFVL